MTLKNLTNLGISLSSTCLLEASAPVWDSIPIGGTGAANSLGQSVALKNIEANTKLVSIIVEGCGEQAESENINFPAKLKIYESVDGDINTWDPSPEGCIATSRPGYIQRSLRNQFQFRGTNSITLKSNTVYLIQLVRENGARQRIAFAKKGLLNKEVTGSAFAETTASGATPLNEFTFGVTLNPPLNANQTQTTNLELTQDTQKKKNATIISVGGISIGFDSE